MAQVTNCPHCNKFLRLPDDATGKQVRCPVCQTPFVVGGGTAPAPAATTSRPATPPTRPAPTPANGPAPVPSARQKAPLRSTAGAAAAPAALAETPRSSAPVVIAWMVPAGLLVMTLFGFVIRDMLIKAEPVAETQHQGSDAPEFVKEPEIPIDPTPRLGLMFIPSKMQFGIRVLDEKDAKGMPKRLTFAPDGRSNTVWVRMDMNDRIVWPFGQWDLTSDGKTDKVGDEVRSTGTPSGKAPGRWAQPPKPSDRTATWIFDDEKIEVTQSVQIVASEQVAPGDSMRRKDTCLVRYRIENKDSRPHHVGLRFILDTFIGSNDGVPFLIPGQAKLCETFADFEGKDVPDFVQALERPDLQNPGTVAHLTLKLGNGLEAPSRVSLVRYDPQLALSSRWNFPIHSFNDVPPDKKPDSCAVLYWEDSELGPGQSRDLGFAYGLGSVAAKEGRGELGVTVGGSFALKDEFTVTAYLKNPAPGQTVKLELPEGLQISASSNAEQTTAEGTKAVTWKVKPSRVGTFKITVRTNTGLAQSKDVTIKSSTYKAIFD